MRKSMKRIMTSVLLSIIMVIQVCNVYAVDTTPSVPSQVTSADYKQIPVYFEGNQVTEFSTYLRKYNDTAANANERFDISGTATFRVRAYAYGTGDNVKLGTYIECLGTDGNWFEMDWRDQEDQVSKDDLKKFLSGNQELNITITDIQFKLPNSNANEKHLRFWMAASTGGKFERQTAAEVQFATKSNVNVTRTVTEVVNQKNVWEVELKVEGKAEEIIPTTDVVLVLDRSGSMSERQNECGKNEHQHNRNCYGNGWNSNLNCNQEEHTHSVACGSTRAQLVQEASKQLVKSLVATKNVNVSVVSFGGNNSSKNVTYEHYKKGTWEAFEKGKGEDGWYSNYTVNTSFTNSSSNLNSGITGALNSPSGGTPMSLGMIKAGLLLKDREANNKIIILLSDGEPTYVRDGSGSGNRNDTSKNTTVDTDTINAASEVKSKVPDVKIYTIAAGSSIGAEGKSLLLNCATDGSYAYKAEDTASALEAVMSDIATEINNSIAEGIKLTDMMSENFTLILPADEMTTNVKTVSYDKMKDIDWSTTGVAISQGSMQEVNNGGVEWNIGKSTAGVPAVMKYRIYMKSGTLGISYNVSSEAKLEYTDADNKAISLTVPNERIKASWARVNVASYSYKSNSKVSNSDFTIWMDVPDSYKEGDLKIGRQTKFSSSSLEINASGDMTIDDKVVVPTSASGAKSYAALSEEVSVSEVSTTPTGSSNTPELVAIVANGKTYNIEEYADVIILIAVVTELGYYYAEPSLEAVVDQDHNFIQPEGVTNISTEVTFKTKSKDVSYTVDISDLENETFNGEKLMDYQLDKAIVQIIDLNNSVTLAKDTHYTIESIVGNEVVIRFNSFVEENSKYKITIYIPTIMGSKVVYGGADENTYLKKYVNKTDTVKATIKATPKVDEVQLETGQIVEVYSGVPFSKEDPISLRYLEIAKIN